MYLVLFIIISILPHVINRNVLSLLDIYIDMKVIITENRMYNLLNKSLEHLFDGFDDTYYTWADFNCGWGVCCDIYAVGFTLPDREHDDYLFKLIDSENYDNNGNYGEELTGELPEICEEQPDITNPQFDTIIFYELFVEELESYLGPIRNWGAELLGLLNTKFGMDAKKIIFI